jgi:hypothetical protein
MNANFAPHHIGFPTPFGQEIASLTWNSSAIDGERTDADGGCTDIADERTATADGGTL